MLRSSSSPPKPLESVRILHQIDPIVAASSALLLDRDGVIIENRDDYVRAPADIEFIPGSLDALRSIAAIGLPTIVVTNQSVVGRGLLSMDQAVALHLTVVEQIEQHGGRIAASYLCPHAPVIGCRCRKPEVGMLERAANDFSLDLTSSYLVGDALSDMDAAEAVGAQGILVLTGRGERQRELVAAGREVMVAPHLAAALSRVHGAR